MVVLLYLRERKFFFFEFSSKLYKYTHMFSRASWLGPCKSNYWVELMAEGHNFQQILNHLEVPTILPSPNSNFMRSPWPRCQSLTMTQKPILKVTKTCIPSFLNSANWHCLILGRLLELHVLDIKFTGIQNNLPLTYICMLNSWKELVVTKQMIRNKYISLYPLCFVVP